MGSVFDRSNANEWSAADVEPAVQEADVLQPARAADDATERNGIRMLAVRDEEYGGAFAVRLHGNELATTGEYSLYATDDGSVLVYDEREQWLYGFDDDLPAPFVAIGTDCFRCDPGVYAKLREALGVDPVIDIGEAD